jgi:hypothetical protein
VALVLPVLPARCNAACRVLEPYRSSVPSADPLVARYSAALRTAVNGTGLLRFSVTGLTLTPVCVMACAIPADKGADDLVEAYGRALVAGGCGLVGRVHRISGT